MITEEKHYTAALYCRLSQDDGNTSESVSIGTQKSLLTRYCKNTLGFTMKYEATGNSQNGWAFVEYLALMIYMKAEVALEKNALTKTYTVHDALLRFAAVVKCKVNNIWENWNLDSKIKDQLQTLGVEFN